MNEESQEVLQALYSFPILSGRERKHPSVPIEHITFERRYVRESRLVENQVAHSVKTNQLLIKFTSFRKVCALFCAPTCKRYSYTYKASLRKNENIR